MDAKAKKHALRMVPYGLYLAGSRRENGQLNVSLVSWFTQTSFDPCLVVLGMHQESEAYAAVQETGVLALAILGREHGELMKGFFKHVPVENGKAGEHEVHILENGCPMVVGLPAAIQLQLKEHHPLGDHATCIFEVVDAHVFDAEAKAMRHEDVGLHYAG